MFIASAMLGCFSLPGVAIAQPVHQLSDGASASLITVAPGDALYSMFGHSAVRVSDPATDIDWTFNYGTFDFDGGFLPRFIMGRLDYSLAVSRYDRALRFYSRVEDRTVVEQHLNLTAAQVNDLFAFLSVNARPENRAYRYNFLFDNCATRIIDAFDAALPGVIEWRYADPDATFRELLDRYMNQRPLVDMGVDVLLGSPVDRASSPEEAVFLPDYLAAAFARSEVRAPNGQSAFVTRIDTVHHTQRRIRAGDTDGLVTLGWFVMLMALAMTFLPRLIRTCRIFDAVLFGTAGLVGILACFMWIATAHSVTTRNWDLTWAWPTHVIVPFFSWNRLGKPGRIYLAAAGVIAVVAAAFYTRLPEPLHPAVVPIAIALAIRSAARAFARPGPT